MKNALPLESTVTSEQLFQCQQQAALFETAFDGKYDMNVFVPTFMNSCAAAGLDADYDRYQWMGNAYILEDISARYGIGPVCTPNGEIGQPEDGANREACYWMGYTYRWWHYYTGQDSREIYKCADYAAMSRAYPGYHTLSCTAAVDILMENLPDPGPQATWGSFDKFLEYKNRTKANQVK